MQDYNFLSDLLDTYQSLPDWLKALWLVMMVGGMLASQALWLRYRLQRLKLERERQAATPHAGAIEWKPNNRVAMIDMEQEEWR